jgi:hypothetical protein
VIAPVIGPIRQGAIAARAGGAAPRRGRGAIARTCAAALATALFACQSAAGELDLDDTSRLRAGVGDRLTWQRGSHWTPLLRDIDALGLDIDFLQLWLTRGWDESWIPRAHLDALAPRGIVPIVTHYYFGDWISKERIEASRGAWLDSVRRMAQRVRGETPVLVILEPEFNIAPPLGETSTLAWSGFSTAMAEAVSIVREHAPNARVGLCAGDFPGPPSLEMALGGVAPHLDFIAFQEMRAVTDREVDRPRYLSVGRSATEYARYLRRAFGRPLLLSYVAVSSYDGWEDEQGDALRDLLAHRDALRDAGVFGWLYFQLHDDPAHTGYFGPAERHFGLVRPDGTPKPALSVFRELLTRPARAAGAASLASSALPPR